MPSVTSVKIGRTPTYLFRKDFASYKQKRCEGIVGSVLYEMGVEEPRKVEQFDVYSREAVIKFVKP